METIGRYLMLGGIVLFLVTSEAISLPKLAYRWEIPLPVALK
jgi:hypothetical protein